MSAQKISNLLFLSLLFLLAVCLSIILAIDLDYKNEGQRMAFQFPFFALMTAWGFAGFLLSRKAKLPEFWQPDIPNSSRFGISALHGLALGIGSVLFDIIRPVAPMYGMQSVHHPLPEAIPVYIYSGIISEFLFHLLPLPLILYLVSTKIFKGGHRTAVFWSAAILLSFWEIRHQIFDPRFQNPIELMRLAWSYLANLSELWLFWRYGFLAGLNQRLSSYAIWHILWPQTVPFVH